MRLTALDGLVVRNADFHKLRLHAPRWYRFDRHLAWLVTPASKRANVRIRFLGSGGSIVHRDIRAFVES